MDRLVFYGYGNMVEVCLGFVELVHHPGLLWSLCACCCTRILYVWTVIDDHVASGGSLGVCALMDLLV